MCPLDEKGSIHGAIAGQRESECQEWAQRTSVNLLAVIFGGGRRHERTPRPWSGNRGVGVRRVEAARGGCRMEPANRF